MSLSIYSISNELPSFPNPFFSGPDIQMQEVFLFIKTDTGKADILGIHEQIIKQVVLDMEFGRHALKMIKSVQLPNLWKL